MKKQKGKSRSRWNENLRLPQEVLRPVGNFLQGELRKLLAKEKALRKTDPFANPDRVLDNAADDTDAAEQFGHAQTEAIQKHIRMRIIQIRKALARVKIGKYGICERCGRFIDTRRLMMFPETTLCVKCERELRAKKKAKTH